MNIVPLIEAKDIGLYGGKAANLAKMLEAGLPVPTGLAVGLDAFNDEGGLVEAAISAIKQQLNESKLYAVRSSALAEDAEDASWAGQFESFLNTKPEDVVSKVVECHTPTKARAKAYASHQGEASS